MRRCFMLLNLFVVVIVLGGCSAMAPQYSASMENVQKLKDSGGFSAKVGGFSPASNLQTNSVLNLRGLSLMSPYGGSYANYVSEAIKQELTLSGNFASASEVEVSGVLVENSIDASGVGTGYGNISAKFIVNKNGVLNYDKIKTAHSEWESAFAGAIAIPRAQQEYPRLVQMLLSVLYADQDFIRAVKQ